MPNGSNYLGEILHESPTCFQLVLLEFRTAMFCLCETAHNRKNSIFVKSGWQLGNLYDESRWQSTG